ncbi:hypothetical protein JL722_3144 [Aureococcus anophagefferens]|nr:hypothetical protein JL722_3144 [Aureococcus anophagefferens]
MNPLSCGKSEQALRAGRVAAAQRAVHTHAARNDAADAERHAAEHAGGPAGDGLRRAAGDGRAPQGWRLLNRALSALAEAPAPASGAASADAPSPRPSAKKAKKRSPKASPAAARARGAAGAGAAPPPARAARGQGARDARRLPARLREGQRPRLRRPRDDGGRRRLAAARAGRAGDADRRGGARPPPAAAGEAVAAPAGAAAPRTPPGPPPRGPRRGRRPDPAAAARTRRGGAESLPPKKRRRKGPPSPRDGGSPSALRAFDALRELHPDFDGTRAFPRNRTIMPTFKLRNCDNLEIPNEAHEAFEQFVICWLFNEVVPLYCHAPNRREATDDGPVPAARRRSPPPGLERLRVLELGGGIGAVSTMIQQMIEMLDPGAPHVVFEPNGALADGPLAHNRDRYRSTFAVLRGVLSDKDAVPFGSGDVDPNHPRAWMWGTVNGGGRSRGTEVLRHEAPTKNFLCPLSANEYGIEFLSFVIQDYDSKLTIFEVSRDRPLPIDFSMHDAMDPDSLRKINYELSEDFLRLPNISTTLVFSVGQEPLSDFRMIERHYFRDQLIKSYGGAAAFYFVGDKLIMHNKAFYKYIPEDSNAQCKSYESKYASAKGEKASAKAESKGAAGAKAEAKGAKSSGGAGAKAQAKGGGDDELWSKESDYLGALAAAAAGGGAPRRAIHAAERRRGPT